MGTVQVKVNGRETRIETGTTLVEMLRGLEMDAAEGVAVAINDAVVSRREWTSRRLQEGDVVEIIRAVQGG